MKNLLITAAIIMATATAASAELRLIRTSVLDESGIHRSGFRTIGGTVTRYVSARDAAKYDFNDSVVVVPAGIDVMNLGEVQEYLAGLDIEATPRMVTPTHNRTREVTVDIGCGVTEQRTVEYTVAGRTYW